MATIDISEPVSCNEQFISSKTYVYGLVAYYACSALYPSRNR